MYYEFKDGEGRLKAGNATGRFLLGDLDPNETREVKLWVGYPDSYGQDKVSLVYSEGSVTAAQPFELTGKAAWLAKTFFNVPALLLILSSLPVLVSLYGLYLKRRQAASQSTN